MAGDLRQVRVTGVGHLALLRFLHAAGADDQQPLRAQVNGRRQRRGLAHRAVAIPAGGTGVVEVRGREDKRDGRRRQQVLLRQTDRSGHALRTLPGLDRRLRAVEREVLP